MSTFDTDALASSGRAAPAVSAQSDTDLQPRIDALRTATEAMDIVLHGLELDRMTFPDRESPDEVRRRWAAQFLIVRNVFFDVEQRVRDLTEILA